MAINISPFPINNPGLFMIQIQTTGSDETFTLPLVSDGTFNFIVNWGDNSAEETITTYNVGNAHIYAVAGIYIISMKGTCTKFDFNLQRTSCIKVKRLLDFVDMGFTELSFCGCTNLTFIASNMKRLTHLTTAYLMFEECSSLTTIPAGIFEGSTGITSFALTFQLCSSITSIPTGLFDNNTSVTTFGGVFNGCSLLSSIPTHLFDNNTLVKYFAYVFGSCTLLSSIPTGLFDNNILVTTFAGAFNNCNLLDGDAPELWLRVPEPTGSSCFTNCTNLDNYASIPDDWKGL